MDYQSAFKLLQVAIGIIVISAFITFGIWSLIKLLPKDEK